MATVRFEPEGVEVGIVPGTRLVDVTDEHPEADVPYSCRSASCGTCRVKVVQGAEALNTPDEVELDQATVRDHLVEGHRLEVVLLGEVAELVGVDQGQLVLDPGLRSVEQHVVADRERALLVRALLEQLARERQQAPLVADLDVADLRVDA